MVIIMALHREKARIFLVRPEKSKKRVVWPFLPFQQPEKSQTAAAFAFVPNFHTYDETLALHEKR